MKKDRIKLLLSRYSLKAEGGLLGLIIILSICWSIFPNGNYEPFIVFMSTIVLILELTRRIIGNKDCLEDSSNTQFHLDRSYHVADEKDVWFVICVTISNIGNEATTLSHFHINCTVQFSLDKSEVYSLSAISGDRAPDWLASESIEGSIINMLSNSSWVGAFSAKVSKEIVGKGRIQSLSLESNINGKKETVLTSYHFPDGIIYGFSAVSS